MELTTKICCQCGEEKDISEFNKDKKNKDGCRSFCKKCQSEYGKLYYLKNKEKIDKRNIDYYYNNSDKERRKEINKKYRLKNVEKLREKNKEYCINNKEKIKERAKKNNLKNKEIRKQNYFNNHLQNLIKGCLIRAKKKEILSESSDKLYDYLKPIYDLGRCECCGKKLVSIEDSQQNNYFSIDQIIPNLGYTIDNVAIICTRCNRLKNDGTPEEHINIGNWQQKRIDNINKNSIGGVIV